MRSPEASSMWELRARTGTQHAELVVLRVGHHHPGHVALADVNGPRTEGDEPRDLGVLIVGGQIQVDPVLHRFSLRNLLEEHVWTHTTRFDPVLAVFRTVQFESERLAPEGGDQEGVAAIDDDALPAKGHGAGSSRRLRARSRTEHAEL